MVCKQVNITWHTLRYAKLQMIPKTNEKEWTDTETGYLCTITKMTGGGGHYCGYVAIPSTHALADRSIDDLAYIAVHGGVTFAEPGMSVHGDQVWIVGFDCAHYFDYIPNYRIGNPDNFKDLAYVEQEIVKLARQLRKEDDKARGNPSLDIATDASE